MDIEKNNRSEVGLSPLVSGDTEKAQQGHRACVSVVIPLYFAEDYIDSLLWQLRTQPLEDIEIICVVDGSPDGTIDIVKEHAKADPRIQWLYQENAGAGAARNAGLQLARGEYLAFLDADDLYDSRFLARMYETAKNHDADLVICQFEHDDCRTGEKRGDRGFQSDSLPTNRVFAPEELSNPFVDIFVIPHNKLYRRETVEREGLRFSTTKANNDNYFVLCSIASARRIVAIPDSLLVLRQYVNPHSISSNRALHTEDMFGNYQALYDWLLQRGLSERYHDSYIEVWSYDLHHNATYERNQRFIDGAAKTLACNEPWARMSDKELRRAVRLETGLVRLKRMVVSRKSHPDARKLELQRLDNEEAAMRDIIRILNSDYGKRIPDEPSTFSSVIEYLKRRGIRQSVASFVKRMR